MIVSLCFEHYLLNGAVVGAASVLEKKFVSFHFMSSYKRCLTCVVKSLRWAATSSEGVAQPPFFFLGVSSYLKCRSKLFKAIIINSYIFWTTIHLFYYSYHGVHIVADHIDWKLCDIYILYIIFSGIYFLAYIFWYTFFSFYIFF